MSHSLKGVVTLRVLLKATKTPKGSFEAFYYNEEGKCRSKQASLHANEPKIAYEIVDMWAEHIAKELGYTYERVSYEVLVQHIEENRRYGNNTYVKASQREKRSLLSHQGDFRAEINKVFEDIGHERLKNIFKFGMSHINELERDRNKKANNINKAKKAMIEAMFASYLETGIDTSKYSNDEEIVNGFNDLLSEHTRDT